jgi:hypothetical protein
VTCDTISGFFVTDIGENADIGGGNNPDGVRDRDGASGTETKQYCRLWPGSGLEASAHHHCSGSQRRASVAGDPDMILTEFHRNQKKGGKK